MNFIERRSCLGNSRPNHAAYLGNYFEFGYRIDAERNEAADPW